MYIVKLDDDFFSGFGEFYRPDHEIFSPELELKINTVGHFYFTVYPKHPLYDHVDKPKKIISVIRYGEKEPLFIGRVSSVEMGFYNEKIITCESELAFLLDSIRVNMYTDPVQYTAEQWLSKILKFHNTNRDRYGSVYCDNIVRKFEAGKVSESLSGKTPVTRKEDYQGAFTTLDIIMKLLVNQYGGVLKLRHEDGKNYIDWLDESDLKLCSQKIELGSNILDIERSVQFDGIVTAIRPVGENVGSGEESAPVTLRAYDASPYIENDDIKQTIDSTASAGSILRFYDCLYSESLVKKYGWIQREIKFDGVKEHIALVRKGVKYLSSMGEAGGITITAADLSRADNSIENFRVGDMAQVNSEIHNLNDRKFVVSSLKLNLSDPSKSILSFGSDMESLTSQVGGTVSYNANVMISDTTNGNISASAALKEAKAYTDDGLSEKVDKIEGKVLSSNDFTDDCKNQIDSNMHNISALFDIKVQKEEGKGLSTNDFTNEYRTLLIYTFNNIDNKVDKVEGKNLSTNDFTDSYKAKLDGIEVGANKTVVDSEMSMTSTNPVENSVVCASINSLTQGLQAANQVIGSLSANLQGAYDKFADYLPLSGGTMSGTITGIFSGSLVTSKGPGDRYTEIKPGSIIHNVAKVDGYAGGISYVNQNTGNEVGTIGALCDANGKLQHYYMGTSYASPIFKVTPNGIVTAATFKGKLSGNASTASKLQTARKINGVGFDGTSDIYLPSGRRWFAGPEGGAGWYKFLTKTMKPLEDFNMILSITNTYMYTSNGIFYIHVRCESGAVTTSLPDRFGWLVRNGVFKNNSVMCVRNGLTLDFYINQTLPAHASISFTVISESSRTGATSYTPVSSANATTTEITASKYSDDIGVVNSANTISAAQTSLYKQSSLNTSPVTVNIAGLFTKYKAVVCNIIGGVNSTCVLPLNYVKTCTGQPYYSNGTHYFQYIDDNTMKIYTGFGSNNPDIYSVEIISLY